MDKKVKELMKGRIKQENDGILIYGNSLTLIIDIGKWLKLKLNNFSKL